MFAPINYYYYCVIMELSHKLLAFNSGYHMLTLRKKAQKLALPASTIAGLLLEQTESTFNTREVVHNNFSYVYDLMIRTSSAAPLLANMIN